MKIAPMHIIIHQQISKFMFKIFTNVFSGLRWSMTQFIMQQTNLGLRNPVDMMYHVQLWMFVLVGPLALILESKLTMVPGLFMFYIGC